MQALHKIVTIGASFIGIGLIFIYYGLTDSGYALLSLGGDAILTYAVVDVLLARERTQRWAGVHDKVFKLIDAELNAVLTDAIFVSGADRIVFGYPPNSTSADFRRVALDAHLNQLRSLAQDLDALKSQAKVEYLRGGAGELYAERAKILGDLQGKYPFVAPAQLGLVIDLEAAFRRLDTGAALAKRYAAADEGNGLQVYERDSSLDIVYQELQDVLKVLVSAIDQGTLKPQP